MWEISVHYYLVLFPLPEHLVHWPPPLGAVATALRPADQVGVRADQLKLKKYFIFQTFFGNFIITCRYVPIHW